MSKTEQLVDDLLQAGESPTKYKNWLKPIKKEVKTLKSIYDLLFKMNLHALANKVFEDYRTAVKAAAKSRKKAVKEEEQP